MSYDNSKFNPALGTFNVTPDAFRRTRSGAMRAITGAGAFRVAVYGDSITTGAGATTSAKSYVGRLRTLLQAKYGDAGDGVCFGGTGLTYGAVTSAGGAPTCTGGTNGNNSYGPNMAGVYFTGAGTYSLTATCDQMTVWVLKDPNGDPALPVSLDSVAQATINNSGSAAVASVAYTPGASGSHTLVLGPANSGKYGVIAGIETRRNGGVGAVVFGEGNSGMLASGLTAAGGYAATGSLGTIPVVGSPDLVVIMAETNDFAASTAVAAYQSTIQTLVTQCKNAGVDVLIVTPPPPDPAKQTGTQIPFANYTSALYTVAAGSNCGVLDMTYRWKDYATSNANPPGYMADQVHPDNAGHADVASAIYLALQSLGIGI